MNIYKIEQTQVSGWDTYDSAVVQAESVEAARNTHPSGRGNLRSDSDTWTSDPAKVAVTFLGVASGTDTEAQVICASFNAG